MHYSQRVNVRCHVHEFLCNRIKFIDFGVEIELVTKQKSGKSHIDYYFLIRLIAVSFFVRKHIFKERLLKN